MALPQSYPDRSLTMRLGEMRIGNPPASLVDDEACLGRMEALGSNSVYKRCFKFTILVQIFQKNVLELE